MLTHCGYIRTQCRMVLTHVESNHCYGFYYGSCYACMGQAIMNDHKEYRYPLDAKDMFWLIVTWASILIGVMLLVL